MDALLIERGEPAVFTTVDDDRLPAGDVTVRVTHSSLNYKDALAITASAPVVRAFPMVPGIDLAGVIEHSTDARWRAGDTVLVNGFGLGELHWGGLAQRASLDADWLVAVPPGLTPARAMALGTAGFTAMLAVMALEAHGAVPGGGDVIVTGAAGGVGGVAIQILSRLGFRVVASTGRLQEAGYLRQLGAAEVIDRATLATPSTRPLAQARWAAAVDSAGSHTLASICAGMRDNGVVAACGLAHGMDFPATVAPFILRGVTLAGINSVWRPLDDRRTAWRRLAEEIDPARLDLMTRTIGLREAIPAAADLLAGRLRGRLVVEL
jgi:acrylyl-CoA reductase (NADPH)